MAENRFGPSFLFVETTPNCLQSYPPSSLQELLTCHTIAGIPAEQSANVRQVAREMGGADGQGLASSGNAVLDTLRERKEQQALGSVVVAIAAMLLA